MRERFAQEFAERFYRRVPATVGDECAEWIGPRSRSGYGIVAGKIGHRLAHRVAWELAYGPVPDGMFVCHHCDNPACVRVEHLFLGTAGDNSRDMAGKGRSAAQRNPEKYRLIAQSIEQRARGRNNPNSLLTEAAVMEIVTLHATHRFTYRELGMRFGVTAGAIFRVVKGDNWGWVTGITRPPRS